MTVRQVRTLSARRLYKAYKHSGIHLEELAGRIREFHPALSGTNVKQVTRWHGGQKPRQPELVVAAYMDLSGLDEGFFYTTPEEEDGEDREKKLRQISGQLRELGLGTLAGDLLALAAASEPLTREGQKP